jgi:hypothetical protein
MPSPKGESEGRPVTRSGRLLGLVAAVGFSIAMWVFIAVAVLGLVLKVIGPRQDLDSKGIAAALTRAYDDVTEGANHPDSLSVRSRRRRPGSGRGRWQDHRAGRTRPIDGHAASRQEVARRTRHRRRCPQLSRSGGPQGVDWTHG